MVWIKRNLFWVTFGLVTVVLLGLGGYYLYSGIQQSSAADDKLGELKSRWQKLQTLDPYPNSTNIAAARESTEKLRQFIAGAKKYLGPIPFEHVAGTEFKRVLDVKISELQKKALQAGVQLPTTNYAFTFGTQRDKVTFAPTSMPLLPELLAEVYTVCSKLFEAKINKILDLKRPMTADDSGLGASGCHRLPREMIPDLGYVLSPYEVTFLTFSPELADTLEAFSSGTNCLIVKAIVVEPNAPGGGTGTGDMPPIDPSTGVAGGPPVPSAPSPVIGGRRPGFPRSLPPQGTAPRAGRPGAIQGTALEPVKTILNEKLFKVTCLVMVVKPVK